MGGSPMTVNDNLHPTAGTSASNAQAGPAKYVIKLNESGPPEQSDSGRDADIYGCESICICNGNRDCNCDCIVAVCCILNRMRISIRGLTGCAGHAHAFCLPLTLPRPSLPRHFKSGGGIHMFDGWLKLHPVALICIVLAVNEFHILYLCECT
ncbi:LOW QUALITY PROTEIN: uncharacterized protein Dere_GG26912 [Drosophila erecta]|nr:LOW QUALITY PROTEIN: uncharacterized protein Dere_GG26912 [Drosophila erecta]